VSSFRIIAASDSETGWAKCDHATSGDSAPIQNGGGTLCDGHQAGIAAMALDKFELAKAQMESALGEPVLQCVGLSPAGQGMLTFSNSDSPLWRPYLTVNGQPHTPLPRAMFLILTPTRVVITGLRNYQPQLDAPILTLQRGGAEIVTTRSKVGSWTYSLRSRASGAELETPAAGTRWHCRGVGGATTRILRHTDDTEHSRRHAAIGLQPPVGAETASAAERDGGRRCVRGVTRGLRHRRIPGLRVSRRDTGQGDDHQLLEFQTLGPDLPGQRKRDL
jgi:hypothetical protein